MKKKFIFGILVCLMLTFLVGCGNKEVPLDEKEPNDSTTEPGEAIEDIELYSDDTKIVYNYNDLYKLVYYHDGTNITGLENYYEMENSAVAAYTKTSLASTYPNATLTQKGRYVIITYNESEYKDLTLEEVKETFSFLQEIQKNN